MNMGIENANAKKRKETTMSHVVNAETVHNWTQRYAALPHYADLTPSARAAAMRAHLAHHRDGLSASEAAQNLARDYPDEFTFTG
jgi:hypothetical protein